MIFMYKIIPFHQIKEHRKDLLVTRRSWKHLKNDSKGQMSHVTVSGVPLCIALQLLCFAIVVLQMTFCNGKFVVIAPQSFFPNKTLVNIDDIKTQPFIKITDKVGPRGPLGSKLEEYLLKNSINLNPTFNTETYQVALALVSKGMGITITDKIMQKEIAPFMRMSCILHHLSLIHISEPTRPY